MPSVHDGHRDRIKNRFLKQGLDGFEEHEILEFLLFYGVPYKDTNELAHNLLIKFGSLSNVFDADMDALMEVKGVGGNIAVLLKLMPSLFKSYEMDKWKEKVKINTTALAIDYLKDIYKGTKQEQFYVLCLNTKNQLITAELLSEGTISETTINTRKFAQVVLRSKAVGVIVSHSHLSGSVTPSFSDIESTKKIWIFLLP